MTSEGVNEQDQLRRSRTRPNDRCSAARLTLEEDLENTTGLLVDESRDTLDSTTASETTDSGLGDSLDVVTQLWL